MSLFGNSSRSLPNDRLHASAAHRGLERAVVLPLALVVILGSLPYRKGIAIAVEHLINRRLTGTSEDEPPVAANGNVGGRDEGTEGRRDNGFE